MLNLVQHPLRRRTLRAAKWALKRVQDDGSFRSLHPHQHRPLADLLPRADLVIGAVLVPGARAPKLITREMLRLMPRGSVFVDIAVDQGGCAETTRPPSWTFWSILNRAAPG